MRPISADYREDEPDKTVVEVWRKRGADGRDAGRPQKRGDVARLPFGRIRRPNVS
jgi:hypothetical protein